MKKKIQKLSFLQDSAQESVEFNYKKKKNSLQLHSLSRDSDRSYSKQEILELKSLSVPAAVAKEDAPVVMAQEVSQVSDAVEDVSMGLESSDSEWENSILRKTGARNTIHKTFKIKRKKNRSLKQVLREKELQVKVQENVLLNLKTDLENSENSLLFSRKRVGELKDGCAEIAIKYEFYQMFQKELMMYLRNFKEKLQKVSNLSDVFNLSDLSKLQDFYDLQKSDISEKVKEISDKEISKVKGLLEGEKEILRIVREWREKYSLDYSNCFGSLCVVGLFEVFTRLEILDWDLQKDLSSFDFHQEVQDDLVLLGHVVVKYVFPKVENMTRFYNFFSKKETKNLLCVYTQLSDYPSLLQESENDAFSSLLQELQKRLYALTQICKRFDVYKFKNIYQDRRKHTLILLEAFENTLTWKRFLEKSRLYEILIIQFLNGAILPLYKIAPNIQDLDIFEKIVFCIPLDWIPAGHSAHEDFKGLEEYLVSLVDLISNESEKSQLTGMFMRINSLDKAALLSK